MNKDKFCSVCGIVTEMLIFCDCGMTYCFSCVNDADFKENGYKSTCKKCKDRNLVEDSADAIKTLENENKNLKDDISTWKKDFSNLRKDSTDLIKNLENEKSRLTKSNNNLAIEIKRLKNSEELLIEENAELKTEINLLNGSENLMFNKLVGEELDGQIKEIDARKEINRLSNELYEAKKLNERISVEKNMLKLKLSTINFIVGEK